MADINQTILDFYKQAKDRDFSRDFQFRVLDVQYKGTTIMGEEDLVFATAAELPGKTIAAKDVPYNGFQFRIPGTVSYNNSDGYTIDFYCDATTSARIRMENWIRDIYDERTSTGDGRLYDDSSISLVQLDSKFKPRNLYTLHGVFPLDCGNIAYSMSGDGEVATVTVSFAYQFFRRNEMQGKLVKAVGSLLGANLSMATNFPD